jgi:hypothetical protein
MIYRANADFWNDYRAPPHGCSLGSVILTTIGRKDPGDLDARNILLDYLP